ncbi:MAG TPA: hypothetical protein VJN88_14145, partial [Ktedonobacterales bacterium]|nr:hypothetical protein [Ktedonobacterales bacterium]
MPGRLEAIFAALVTALARTDGSAWLVGGVPRDVLLGAPSEDVDVVTSANPMSLAGALRAEFGASVAALPRSVRVAFARSDGEVALQMDIAPLRGERIEDDLRERDYTVNAMALPIHSWRDALLPSRDDGPAALSGLLDPLGGREDLARRRLRLAGEQSLRRDPGRIVRGARLIARFQLEPTPETLALAWEAAPMLDTLPPDRLPFEMNLLLAASGCADGLAFLRDCGALARLLPTLASDARAAHALACMRQTERLQEAEPRGEAEQAVFAPDAPLRAWYAAALPSGLSRLVALRWGLLLHAETTHEPPLDDVESPSVIGPASLIRTLSPAARSIAYGIEARACFTARMLAVHEPDERDLRRLFALAGEETVDVLTAAAICATALAADGQREEDEARVVAERARAIVALYFADRARLIPPPLLTGGDLIQELGAQPGPAIRRLLERVREAQIEGDVATHAEALALAR